MSNVLDTRIKGIRLIGLAKAGESAVLIAP
jgi:hypothetical protein